MILFSIAVLCVGVAVTCLTESPGWHAWIVGLLLAFSALGVAIHVDLNHEQLARLTNNDCAKFMKYRRGTPEDAEESDFEACVSVVPGDPGKITKLEWVCQDFNLDTQACEYWTTQPE